MFIIIIIMRIFAGVYTKNDNGKCFMVVIQSTHVLIKSYRATVSWFVIITRTASNVCRPVMMDLTSLSFQLTRTTVTTKTECGRLQNAGLYATAPVRSRRFAVDLFNDF